MAKQEIVISGFLGMNRSLTPHQLNPAEDGDARMYEVVSVDPSQLRELTARDAWLFLGVESTQDGSPNLVWPRRVDANGDYEDT